MATVGVKGLIICSNRRRLSKHLVEVDGISDTRLRCLPHLIFVRGEKLTELSQFHAFIEIL